MAEEKEEVVVEEEEEVKAAPAEKDSVDSFLADLDGLLEAAPAGGEAVKEEEAAEVAVDETPAEDAPAEDAPDEDAPAEIDVSVLVETLEIDEPKAAALYQASQEMERTRGVNPEELAAMLAEDFNLRMQLERIAGISEEEAM
jgi:hypothetical protein